MDLTKNVKESVAVDSKKLEKVAGDLMEKALDKEEEK